MIVPRVDRCPFPPPSSNPPSQSSSIPLPPSSICKHPHHPQPNISSPLDNPLQSILDRLSRSTISSQLSSSTVCQSLPPTFDPSIKSIPIPHLSIHHVSLFHLALLKTRILAAAQVFWSIATLIWSINALSRILAGFSLTAVQAFNLDRSSSTTFLTTDHSNPTNLFTQPHMTPRNPQSKDYPLPPTIGSLKQASSSILPSLTFSLLIPQEHETIHRSAHSLPLQFSLLRPPSATSFALSSSLTRLLSCCLNGNLNGNLNCLLAFNLTATLLASNFPPPSGRSPSYSPSSSLSSLVCSSSLQPWPQPRLPLQHPSNRDLIARNILSTLNLAQLLFNLALATLSPLTSVWLIAIGFFCSTLLPPHLPSRPPLPRPLSRKLGRDPAPIIHHLRYSPPTSHCL